MGMRKTSISVVGMTCSACETRIAGVLEGIDGMMAVRVSAKDGRADLEYDDGKTSIGAIKAAVESIGYTVGGDKDNGGIVAAGIGILLVALHMIANAAGLFNVLPAMDASLGYGMLFVVGALTSVHCVAMCGGIALSQSLAKTGGGRGSAEASGARPPEGKFRTLLPGLLYNGGRVVSYTILGGVVGALGSAFSFSPVMKGIITAAAGIFMVLLGLGMLGILSRQARIPRGFSALVREAAARLSPAFRKRGPFAVGLLNGLMPCGPLQTMQLYALGTGSFLAGALSMFIFSVGTVPLMLGFSLTAAFMPRRFVPAMVRASAVLVLFLGMITFGRAATLAGIALPGRPVAAIQAGGAKPGLVRAVVREGVQTVFTDFGSSGYYLPFVVQAGIPVKWTIRVKAEGLNGCNNPLTVPMFGIRKTLVPGDNLIEFTPGKEGFIPYTCWMGMISSRVTVVKSLDRTYP